MNMIAGAAAEESRRGGDMTATLPGRGRLNRAVHRPSPTSQLDGVRDPATGVYLALAGTGPRYNVLFTPHFNQWAT